MAPLRQQPPSQPQPVQLVAKVTAFPALNGTTSSGYTAYSTTSTSNPPKVPGSPGCISPDSTTGMVGSNGFEASLYDEFNKFSRNSQANQYLLPAQTSVVQQGPPLQQGTYLVAPKTEPRNEDYSRYYLQGQQNFLHGQQNTHETVTIPAIVSSTTPSENDSEGLGGSLADLDSLTDLLPMMAPDLVTCIKGEIDEEQPQQQQIQPQTAQRPTTTQLNLHQQNPNTLQTLHSSSHLDFNCSPELTNLLLSDLGVAMPAGNEWLDDNLIKL